MKLYTFELRGYFMSRENIIDFILMVLGLIWLAWNIPTCQMEGASNHDTDEKCHKSRMFGTIIFLVRFITLSFKHSALRMLMLTIVMGMVKSFFTFCVLVFILMTYGYLGVVFFGTVKRGFNINKKVNFENWLNAFFLLVRCATGEDWNSLMHDAAISEPYCRTPPGAIYYESNCGSKTLA